MKRVKCERCGTEDHVLDNRMYCREQKKNGKWCFGKLKEVKDGL